MRKLNWTLILSLIALIIFWLFAIYTICQFIELKANKQIHKAQEEYRQVIKRKSKDFEIAMFRETYNCPIKDTKICNTIVDIADEYGVDGQVMIDLGYCESWLSPIQGNIDKDDHGWYQINSRYHDIGMDCSYDLECSARFTAQKISEGQIYLWNCWDLIK